MSSDPLNIAMEQWEDAHSLLSAALKGYLDSCTNLETILGLGCEHRGSSDSITSRIESTLSSLRHDTTRQLAQITTILTRTRNKLVSPICRLPDDVLLEIFLRVVYTRENKNLSVEECVRVTYSSLYNLVAICSDWRDLIYNQGVLWEIIPASDQWVERQVTERSIQRAGNRGLRLAVTISNSNSLPQLPKVVEEHISRFYALNMQCYCLGDIHGLVGQLSRGGSRLSELSIYSTDYYRHTLGGFESNLLIYPLDQNFTRMVQSLSILRLSGCQMQWADLTFSDRLVELFVRGINLPNSGSAMASFLTAISSANELRELKVIDLRACYNSAETAGLMARPKIVFPKLRTLALQDLLFNVLEIFLLVLAPGSYHSTIGITLQSIQILHPSNYASRTADPETLVGLLSQSRADRLSLRAQLYESNWLRGSEFFALLTSVPGLKELELDGWKFDREFDSDFCGELSRAAASTSTSDNECDTLILPRLEFLELTQVSLSDEEGFKEFLAHIPIQKMVLGGFIITPTRGDTNYWESLQGDEDIVVWLKCSLPEFYFVSARYTSWDQANGWLHW